MFWEERAKLAETLSLPVRGAWVEMLCLRVPSFLLTRRSPCGERGLKCDLMHEEESGFPSLPVRGAWVEMVRSG